MTLDISNNQMGAGSGQVGCQSSEQSNGNCVISSVSWVYAIILIALFGMTLVATSQAQTLDQAIRAQLDFDCLGLGVQGGNAAVTGTPLGPNLDVICNSIASGSGGVSTGGGAGASPQTLAVSVENRRKDRLEEGQNEAENLGNGWGLFVSGNVEALNRDRTSVADGFDSDITGVTFGVDKLFTPQLLAGAAFTYISTNGSFEGGGGFNTNSFGGTVYASFMPAAGFFFDQAIGFARKDHTVSRGVSFFEPGSNNLFSGTANSDTNGNDFSVRWLLGYDHSIANITVGPRFGANYTYTKIDGYSERDGGAAIRTNMDLAGNPAIGLTANANTGGAGLALRYEDQDVSSMQSTLGMEATIAIPTGWGVLIPQFSADYIHEFLNDQRVIAVQFVEDLRGPNANSFVFRTENPVRDWVNLGFGAVAVLPHGFQPFVNFRVMVGNEQFSNYAGSFGLRLEM